MKRSLLSSFAVIITLGVSLSAYTLPKLATAYSLSEIRYVLLVISLICLMIILATAVSEQIVTISLDRFLKNLSSIWKKRKNFQSIDSANIEPEFAQILNMAKDLTENDVERIRLLEDKSGDGDTYYRRLTTMSHQLRTPITGLRWALKNIEDDISKGIKVDQALIITMSETATRMSTIVEDLLSNINNTTDNSTQTKLVDLEKCIDQVVRESSLVAKQKNMTISVNHISTPVPTVRGNEQQISFIIHTLINNAITYGDSNSEISIGIKQENERVKMNVHNTGIIIKNKEMGLIFSQFNRSSEAIKLNPNGSGLSLHMANQITLDHGGNISFESSKKTGTNFILTLPISHSGELETFIRH